MKNADAAQLITKSDASESLEHYCLAFKRVSEPAHLILEKVIG